MSEPRKCQAPTKSGEPCKAQPLKDQDVCLAHADEKTRDSTGFGGSQAGSGRPRNPRMVDIIRERMEAELDDWMKVLLDAREAERAVVVGNGPTAHVDMVPDHPTRLAALREAADRSYGRPKQQTEITGGDGGPLEVVSIVPSDADERSAKAAALLKRHGYVDA